MEVRQFPRCGDDECSVAALPYTFGGRFSGRHYPTGCLLQGAAELKFCLTPKGTAAKSIWQHVAENPCDSPWLSWSASPLVAFWLAVAQAKPGSASSRSWYGGRQ
ncbi:unnamed protein product [Cladocopium goreaui]|uniref:Uncharacterized protein n=1 Tax=Cladocopium goreaui TaxID=2562237 RepID=A0A9P1M2Q3_9DINO|nr:unnamed protein product [Cladocopium goreaui]